MKGTIYIVILLLFVGCKNLSRKPISGTNNPLSSFIEETDMPIFFDTIKPKKKAKKIRKLFFSSVTIDTTKTIEEGFRLLGTKDTLYLKDGTYRQVIYNSIPNGKVLAAVNQRKAIIKPDSADRAIVLIGKKNTTIKGIKIDGSNLKYCGVYYTKDSDFNKLINCEIVSTHFTGVLINGDSEHNIIEGNEIHDFGNDKWDHGIYVGSSNNLIRYNTIYNISGNGVQVYRSSSIGVDSITVEYNKIDRVGLAGNGSGIILSRGSGHIARNNTISNSVYGISVRYGAIDTEVYKNHLSNNIDGLLIGKGIVYKQYKNIFKENKYSVRILKK